MNRQQFEALEESIKSIARSDRDYVRLYDDNGELTIIFDGDFTVDELRQIVAACDAAMGTQQAVETVTQHIVFHDQGYERRTTKTTPLA
jgi:hypothetical protein